MRQNKKDKGIGDVVSDLGFAFRAAQGDRTRGHGEGRQHAAPPPDREGARAPAADR